jgi:hypothetical protein
VCVCVCVAELHAQIMQRSLSQLSCRTDVSQTHVLRVCSYQIKVVMQVRVCSYQIKVAQFSPFQLRDQENLQGSDMHVSSFLETVRIRVVNKAGIDDVELCAWADTTVGKFKERLGRFYHVQPGQIHLVLQVGLE